MLRVLDLFSGIGGFSLGLERTGGFETVAFCERDEYCRAVLARHWPSVPCFPDVRELTGSDVSGIDVITGGFPCQPFSVAGQRKGAEDERHLWPEIARLLGEIRPRFAILENVSGLLSIDGGRVFGDVLGDLAALGYDAEWNCISAAHVGAPHIRDRVWIVAYPQCGGLQKSGQRAIGISSAQGKGWQANKPFNVGSQAPDDVAHANSKRRQERDPTARGRITRQLARRIDTRGRVWEPEPGLGRVANGIPNRVDRLRALGNSIVPQIAEIIGQAILESEGQ